MSERNGDHLRLFVACELPGDAKEALRAVQDGLRSEGATEALRWVRPEGIHLTLKFLGAVPRSKVAAVEEALASTVEPLSLSATVGRLGTFGGARMRVVWAGLEGDVDGLVALAGRIDEALSELGFDRERRPFAAHLTLARVRDRATDEERRRAALAVRGYRISAFPSMTFSEVVLMESRLGPGGSTYHRLGGFPRAKA